MRQVHQVRGGRDIDLSVASSGGFVELEDEERAVLLDRGHAPVEALAGLELAVRSVPGHSPAHLAYAADGCLFSGDVLFAGSVGRTDLPGSSWETLLDSIRSLVDGYPPETIVYPGHGPATTLGEELARNPFLDELRVDRQT